VLFAASTVLGWGCSAAAPSPTGLGQAASVTFEVTNDGGTFALGEVRLTFPPGAVAAPTTFTMACGNPSPTSLPEGFVGVGTPCKITPHHSALLRVVGLQMPCDQPGQVVDLLRLDDDQDSSWEQAPAGRTMCVDGHVNYTLRTFSVLQPAKPPASLLSEPCCKKPIRIAAGGALGAGEYEVLPTKQEMLDAIQDEMERAVTWMRETGQLGSGGWASDFQSFFSGGGCPMQCNSVTIRVLTHLMDLRDNCAFGTDLKRIQFGQTTSYQWWNPVGDSPNVSSRVPIVGREHHYVYIRFPEDKSEYYIDVWYANSGRLMTEPPKGWPVESREEFTDASKESVRSTYPENNDLTCGTDGKPSNLSSVPVNSRQPQPLREKRKTRQESFPQPPYVPGRPNACRCAKVQNNQLAWNPAERVCQACPVDGPPTNIEKGVCACPRDEVWDPGSKACNCPAGEKRTLIGTCVRDCGKKTWDAVRKSCEPDFSGEPPPAPADPTPDPSFGLPDTFPPIPAGNVGYVMAYANDKRLRATMTTRPKWEAGQAFPGLTAPPAPYQWYWNPALGGYAPWLFGRVKYQTYYLGDRRSTDGACASIPRYYNSANPGEVFDEPQAILRVPGPGWSNLYKVIAAFLANQCGADEVSTLVPWKVGTVGTAVSNHPMFAASYP
jgi:hypothetical protein